MYCVVGLHLFYMLLNPMCYLCCSYQTDPAATGTERANLIRAPGAFVVESAVMAGSTAYGSRAKCPAAERPWIATRSNYLRAPASFWHGVEQANRIRAWQGRPPCSLLLS